VLWIQSGPLLEERGAPVSIGSPGADSDVLGEWMVPLLDGSEEDLQGRLQAARPSSGIRCPHCDKTEVHGAEAGALGRLPDQWKPRRARCHAAVLRSLGTVITLEHTRCAVPFQVWYDGRGQKIVPPSEMQQRPDR